VEPPANNALELTGVSDTTSCEWPSAGSSARARWAADSFGGTAGHSHTRRRQHSRNLLVKVLAMAIARFYPEEKIMDELKTIFARQ
jgi:hypothetical protein